MHSTILQLRLGSIVALFVCLLLASPVYGTGDGTNPPPGERPAPDVFSRITDAGVATDYDGANHIIVYDYATNHVTPSGVSYV